MILLVSEEPVEEMSLELYNHLKNRADVYLIQNTSIPYENNITFYPDKGILKGILYFDNKELNITDIDSVYTRISNASPPCNISESSKQAIEAERLICLNTLFDNLDAMVINRSNAQFFNSSKLFQSAIIQKYGFKIPKSLLSNNAVKVKEFVEQNAKNGVIYKSASSERSKVQRFKKEDFDKLDLLKNSPHLFQECINGVDIRVHALATGEVFACKIQTDTNDYRYDKNRNIVPVEIPEKIKEKAVRMTLDMGLYLSGIDFRKTKDDTYYCFEVNPSPAFVWYEKQTGLQITKSVANMMINSKKYKNSARRIY